MKFLKYLISIKLRKNYLEMSKKLGHNRIIMNLIFYKTFKVFNNNKLVNNLILNNNLISNQMLKIIKLI